MKTEIYGLKKINDINNTAKPLINAFAADHKTSPATISSMLTGVTNIASNIPFVVILVYEPNVPSKEAAYIEEEDIIPGIMYRR